MVAPPLGRRKVSSTRLEHRERMRGDVLTAARELIAQHGTDGLTMRRLGNRVGVTAATLYGYFPSKEAVLEALLEEKLSALNEAMSEAARDVAPGVVRLLAFARGYRNFALTHPDFYQMFICNFEPPNWDDLEAEARSQDQVLKMLHREIRESMERGELVRMDVNLLLRLLWAVGHGYVTLEMTNCFGVPQTTPADREAMYLRHMIAFLRGYATPDYAAALARMSVG